MKTSEDTEAKMENSRPYARAPGTAGGRRALRRFDCEHCGREFRAKPVHDQRGISHRRFCSMRCAGADRSAAKRANASIAYDGGSRSGALNAGQPPKEVIRLSRAQDLTPAEAAKVRCYIFGLLRSDIPMAHRVVTGEASWTPTQAKIFSLLLDKCIPDMPAVRIVKEQMGPEDLSVLSPREIEALAADTAKATS